MLSTVILITLIALQAIGMLLAVALVGKPREPITGGSAATTVFVAGLSIAGMLYVLLNL